MTVVLALLAALALRSKVVQTKAGDWDAVASQAIKQAQKDQAARENATTGA